MLGSLIPTLGRFGTLAGRVTIGLAVALLAILVIIDVAADEPLRRQMERRLNDRLDGYRVELGGLDFHVFGFSLDLRDLVLIQEANPHPPVAHFPLIAASIHWRALLRGRVVGDMAFDRPVLHVDRAQLATEASDDTPASERGWQEALQAIYPFKINHFTVVDGTLTYIDSAGAPPVELTNVNFRADNVRNIRSPERTYPSEVALDAVVFGSGRLRVAGHANFLATPHAGVRGDIELTDAPLDAIRPVAGRYNLQVAAGAVSAAGEVEYAPAVKTAHVRELMVDGLRADYVHSGATAARERERARQIGAAAAEVSNQPGLLIRIDEARIRNAQIGFVNDAHPKGYRVFMDGTTLEVRNLSNHRTDGIATARLRGRFMGSGATVATASFRPEVRGPDFDLAVKITDTGARAMNDLWRTYGRFDVADGFFSLVSELSVKNGTISGYVKPLFRDLDVYDARQDGDKNVFQQMYEGVIGGISRILENRPRDEVATRADVWGRIENPEASTLQVVVRLIQNAFFRAILPSFENELATRRRAS
ncbi:MAG TPA: DUF748 domain-containing protein [Candidatus Binatia bacterium]|nr:DUF748 domain-containing protein [Candidatus Binatia bacterium]